MSTRVTPVSSKTAWAVCERDDDGPPERAGERPVAGDDPDDAIADRVARALHRERRSDGQAVLRGEALGDQGAVLVGFAQRRAGDEGEVVESRVERSGRCRGP